MGEIKIGAHTYGNPIRRGTHNNVTIGKFCSLAEGLLLDCGYGHDISNVSTYPFHAWEKNNGKAKNNIVYKGDIVIGNDVWIGENVTIMSGVTIGDGAVIGTKSLVTKNVEPYSVVGGVPVKLLKYRFSKETIDLLLKIKWWEWPDEKIKDNLELLTSNDLDRFLTLTKNSQ